jgi:hypothetical protein
MSRKLNKYKLKTNKDFLKVKKRKKNIDVEKIRQAVKARESLRKIKIEASTDVYLYTSCTYLTGFLDASNYFFLE